MMNRKDIGQTIDGLHISNYFGRSENLRQTFKDSAKFGEVSLGDSGKQISHSLKDGIDGFFARNGFELMDLTPNLPLSNFFWAENVPVRYGGGFAEQISAFRLNYQLADARLTGTTTNERSLTEVKEEKITVPVYAFQNAILVTDFERMKAGHINYDIFGQRAEALRLSYQRELELFAFQGNLGVSDIKTTSKEFVGGLLNQKKETSHDFYFGEDWLSDTVDINTLVDKFIDVINTLIIDLMYDSSKYPDTMLVPTSIYRKLLQPAVVGGVGQTSGTGIAVSNLAYLEEQLSARTGSRFDIRELPYIDKDITKNMTTAGIVDKGKKGLGKVVIYRNDESVMRFNIPMALTGGAAYKVQSGWLQDYISLVSPLLVIYPTIAYLHNGAE